MSDKLKALENRVYKTAVARFGAASRLKAKQNSLVHLIVFITLAQISISITLLKAGDGPYSVLVACLSVSFSVFIAIVLNPDSVSKGVLHAHLLYKCGMDLMSLYHKICACTDDNVDAFNKYSSDYSDIISDCSINHDAIDFGIAECQIYKKGRSLKCYYGMVAFFATYRMVSIYFIYLIIICYVSYFLFTPKF